MRKITSLLMLFCMCVGMAWAAPTDLPEITTDLNNPIYYTIRNTRSTSGKFLYWTENGVKDNNAVFESSLFYITGESLANCKIHNVATNLLFSGAGAWTEAGVSCSIEVTPHSSQAGLAIKFNNTSLNEQNTGNGYTTWGANDAGSIFVFEKPKVNKAVTLPKLSTEGNIKWYTIKNVRQNKFATYAATGRMTQQTDVQDGSLFYFTGSTADGVAIVKIHNAQAGENLFANDNTWTAIGSDWYIGARTATGLAISKTADFSGNNSWNDYQGSGSEVDYWGATDAGSIWVIEEFGADVQEVITKMLAAQTTPIFGEPKYDETAYNSLVAAYNTLKANTTVANYNACKAIIADLELYMPEVGKYYVIEAPLYYNTQGVHKALFSRATNLEWGTFDKANNAYYWTPVATATEGLAWKNVETGKFILGQANNDTEWAMAETSEGAEFSLVILQSGDTQSEYQYAISVTGRHMHTANHGGGAGSGGHIVSWETNAPNTASSWTITEVDDPTANKPIDVKYNFTYGGEEKFNQTTTTLVGEEYPAFTVNFPYGVVATKPAGTIAEGDVVDGVVTKEIVLSVELPFVPAENYASITKWYYIKIKGESYLSHNSELTYIDLANKTSLDAANLDAYTWAFVGNAFDGFQVVNKAAGSGKILSSSTTMEGNNGSGTYPVMTATPVAEGNNTYWTLSASAHQTNGFYMAQKGFDGNKMNNRDNKLAYWSTGADNGSTFTVEEYGVAQIAALQTLVNQVKAAAGSYVAGEGLGYYTQASVDAVTAAVAVADTELAEEVKDIPAIITATTNLNTAIAGLSLKVPTQGKFYRFSHNYGGEVGNLYVQAVACGVQNKANGMLMNAETGAASIFYYADDQLLSYSKGLYVKDDGDARGLQAVGVAGGAARFEAGTVPGQLGIFAGGSFHANTSGDVRFIDHCGSAHSADHNFTVEEVTSLPVTVSAAGYASFYAPVAVTLPEGLTAYYVSSINGDYAVFAEINGTIPANTGVLLAGAEKTYELTIAEDTEAIEGNMLNGTVASEYVTADAYVLSKQDEVVGFYKAAKNQQNNTSWLNNGFKAYLSLNNSAVKAFFFNFDGETTAIDAVEVVNPNAPIYDLSGRRVLSTVKGGIYIQNGKKFIVK